MTEKTEEEKQKEALIKHNKLKEEVFDFHKGIEAIIDRRAND